MNTYYWLDRLDSVLHRILLGSTLFGLAVLGSAQGQVTVCLDPGHPTLEDKGTKGRRALEVQVNWLYARLLREALLKDGIKVVLTKRQEKMILSNERRAQIATWSKANLLVRLHCDASPSSGFAVYYPGAQGKAADGTVGPSFKVIHTSASAAKTFHEAMAIELKGVLPDLGVKTDAQTLVGSKQGALTGSIYSTVPTLLVEMCVLTNPHDEDFILSKQGRVQMVKALESGVLAALGRKQD